jgi:hypothetical protein
VPSRFPVMAQQPREQTRDEMHRDADKGMKTSEPSEQMQHDTDKGTKTRNSESLDMWPIKTSQALLLILGPAGPDHRFEQAE